MEVGRDRHLYRKHKLFCYKQNNRLQHCELVDVFYLLPLSWGICYQFRWGNHSFCRFAEDFHMKFISFGFTSHIITRLDKRWCGVELLLNESEKKRNKLWMRKRRKNDNLYFSSFVLFNVILLFLSFSSNKTVSWKFITNLSLIDMKNAFPWKHFHLFCSIFVVFYFLFRSDCRIWRYALENKRHK